jgi:hypothetical protein
MMQILLRAFSGKVACSGKVAFRFSAENATAQEASGQRMHISEEPHADRLIKGAEAG